MLAVNISAVTVNEKFGESFSAKLKAGKPHAVQSSRLERGTALFLEFYPPCENVNEDSLFFSSFLRLPFVQQPRELHNRPQV